MITQVNGDLLACKAQYIAHQCNCVTTGDGKGLAYSLFKKFPYANTYKTRTKPSSPGTFSLHGDGINKRFVVNLYAQYRPGRAGRFPDTMEKRLDWLLQGLTSFVTQHEPKELALPYNIGCGLAGGNWKLFLAAIEKFSAEHSLPITIYRYD